MNRYRVAFLIDLALAGLALALIWEAEVRAYWVWPTPLVDAVVQRARVEPAPVVLDTIARQRLGLPATDEAVPALEEADVIQKAERILTGTVEFPRRSPVAVSVPFERSNFKVGRLSDQLFIAGLVPVDQLLRAYRASSDDRFLRAAIDEIVAFERVDRYSLVPSGFQWNDHALANTMSILAEAWSRIRNRSDIDASAALALLRLAERTAERLAKPAFFTFRTNHGIMQSVALLQFATAFPTLESAKRMGDLGCVRLKEQFRFYISTEGAVLEHSAGYHEFGRQLLAMALQLSDLGSCSATEEWQRKREGTRAFSALLRRPDRSLPIFGNTDGMDRPADDDVPAKPGHTFSLLPVSGFAVWWSGLDAWPDADRLSQTVVTWSNFPTRAHKHADDLGVLVWSRGVPWITSVGYWPYDAAGYSDAQSWPGANAPHFLDEPTQNIPPTRLLGSADAGRLRAISLERPDSTGMALLRRQIVEIDGSTWLVVDSVEGGRTGKVSRLWTFASVTEWADVVGTNYLLRAKGSALSARMTVLGDLSGPPLRHMGNTAPYAGWNVLGATPTPAPALSVLQDGPRSMLVTVLQIDEEKHLRALAPPKLRPNATPDNWSAVVETRQGSVSVTWTPASVSADFPEGSTTADMNPARPGLAASRTEIVSAYEAMGTRYKRFREHTDYRHRLTSIVAVLFVLQQLVLLGMRRFAPVAVMPLRILAGLFWPLFGAYAAYVFLA